jgi:hypothetical protein
MSPGASATPSTAIQYVVPADAVNDTRLCSSQLSLLLACSVSVSTVVPV